MQLQQRMYYHIGAAYLAMAFASCCNKSLTGGRLSCAHTGTIGFSNREGGASFIHIQGDDGASEQGTISISFASLFVII